METKPTTADWTQRGHIGFWRYKPMPRMYSGWHFAGDVEGCHSLRELITLLLATDYAAHRTLTLTDPRSVGADQIFAEHELKVLYPKKLRLSFDPEAPDDGSGFEESADRLELALGRTWLLDWQSVLPEVARGDADFSLWFDARKKDEMKRVSFWWWPEKR
jgi:hypothetical protein